MTGLPEQRALYRRVGLMVCGTAVGAVAFVVFLLGSSIDAEEARYRILFEENVKGMVVGSKVNFQGVPIGAVSDMAFRDGCTAVEIAVDPRRATIQSVTRARLDRLLVTGQVTVELEGWEAGAPRLPTQAQIETKDDPLHSLKSSLPEVVTRVEILLADASRSFEALEDVLRPENRRRIDRILALTESAAETLPDLLDAARSRAVEMRGVIAAAEACFDPELLRRVAGSTERALRAVEAMPAVVEGVGGEASALFASLRMPLLGAVLSARDSMRELQGVARAIRLAPQSLLFGEVVREIKLPATPVGGR